MMDVKVSEDKHISRWVDRENLIYVRRNRIENSVSKMTVSGKRCKTLGEVKPVKIIRKNPKFSRDNSRAKGGPFFT